MRESPTTTKTTNESLIWYHSAAPLVATSAMVCGLEINGVLGYLSMNYFKSAGSVEKSVLRPVLAMFVSRPVAGRLFSTPPRVTSFGYRCCSRRINPNQSNSLSLECVIVKPCANVPNTRRAIWASCKNEVLSFNSSPFHLLLVNSLLA